AAWWDGTAIWMALANNEYQSADLTWLAHVPLLVNLLTHLATIWEVSFCVLVWPRLTRPLVLTGAVLVHLGIALCLGMITFGLIMLVGCLSFVPPRLLHELVADQRVCQPVCTAEPRCVHSNPVVTGQAALQFHESGNGSVS